MGNGRRRRRIPEPRVPAASNPLRFSFKHLDTEHLRFALGDCSKDYLDELFICLRVYSTWSVDQFSDQNNKARRHVIKFEETTEKNGFPHVDKEQLAIHDCWQFQVCRRCLDNRCSHNQWRAHGMLIEEIFFIVWLDPRHHLYLQS